MILDKVSERQIETMDKVQAVWFSLPADEQDEFLAVIKDDSFSAVVIAEVVVDMSDYAKELGVRALARRINSFRRGENLFARENGMPNA